MSRRSNLLEGNDNFREQNLRFVRNELEDNINQFFSGSGADPQVNVPPRDSIIVQPTPGDADSPYRSVCIKERREFLRTLGLSRSMAQNLAMRTLKRPDFNLKYYKSIRFRMIIEMGDSRQDEVDESVVLQIKELLEQKQMLEPKLAAPSPPRNLDWNRDERAASSNSRNCSLPRERLTDNERRRQRSNSTERRKQSALRRMERIRNESRHRHRSHSRERRYENNNSRSYQQSKRYSNAREHSDDSRHHSERETRWQNRRSSENIDGKEYQRHRRDSFEGRRKHGHNAEGFRHEHNRSNSRGPPCENSNSLRNADSSCNARRSRSRSPPRRFNLDQMLGLDNLDANETRNDESRRRLRNEYNENEEVSLERQDPYESSSNNFGNTEIQYHMRDDFEDVQNQRFSVERFSDRQSPRRSHEQYDENRHPFYNPGAVDDVDRNRSRSSQRNLNIANQSRQENDEFEIECDRFNPNNFKNLSEKFFCKGMFGNFERESSPRLQSQRQSVDHISQRRSRETHDEQSHPFRNPNMDIERDKSISPSRNNHRDLFRIDGDRFNTYNFRNESDDQVLGSRMFGDLEQRCPPRLQEQRCRSPENFANARERFQCVLQQQSDSNHSFRDPHRDDIDFVQNVNDHRSRSPHRNTFDGRRAFSPEVRNLNFVSTRDAIEAPNLIPVNRFIHCEQPNFNERRDFSPERKNLNITPNRNNFEGTNLNMESRFVNCEQRNFGLRMDSPSYEMNSLISARNLQTQQILDRSRFPNDCNRHSFERSKGFSPENIQIRLKTRANLFLGSVASPPSNSNDCVQTTFGGHIDCNSDRSHVAVDQSWNKPISSSEQATFVERQEPGFDKRQFNFNTTRRNTSPEWNAPRSSSERANFVECPDLGFDNRQLSFNSTRSSTLFDLGRNELGNTRSNDNHIRGAAVFNHSAHSDQAFVKTNANCSNQSGSNIAQRRPLLPTPAYCMPSQGQGISDIHSQQMLEGVNLGRKPYQQNNSNADEVLPAKIARLSKNTTISSQSSEFGNFAAPVENFNSSNPFAKPMEFGSFCTSVAKKNTNKAGNMPHTKKLGSTGKATGVGQPMNKNVNTAPKFQTPGNKNSNAASTSKTTAAANQTGSALPVGQQNNKKTNAISTVKTPPATNQINKNVSTNPAATVKKLASTNTTVKATAVGQTISKNPKEVPTIKAPVATIFINKNANVVPPVKTSTNSLPAATNPTDKAPSNTLPPAKTPVVKNPINKNANTVAPVKTPAPTNPTAVGNPSTSAVDKPKRKRERKRAPFRPPGPHNGFHIGRKTLSYINSGNMELPQAEADSYCVRFFAKMHDYTVGKDDKDAEAGGNSDASESEDELINNKSKLPKGKRGKAPCKKKLVREWSELYQKNDYKNWHKWWINFKWCEAAINKRLNQFKCMSLGDRFAALVKNKKYVSFAMKSGHFALEKNTGDYYRDMRAIFALMQDTFLDRLTRPETEQLQDMIRNVPNHIWLHKMRSMVYLWTRYGEIVKSDWDKKRPKINDYYGVCRKWRHPVFHWSAKIAFIELKTISELSWPEHNELYPSVQ